VTWSWSSGKKKGAVCGNGDARAHGTALALRGEIDDQERRMTRVTEVMTRGVHVLSAGDSLQAAAQAMDQLNVGAIPICDGGGLVGLVTDRDIVVRGVAPGLSMTGTPLSEVMSAPVRCCHEDDSLADVTELMSTVQLRRVPVLGADGQLVGMLSLGDVAAKASAQQASSALSDISEPAEPDRSDPEPPPTAAAC
jgi:CBS domain-containing protein